MKYLRATSALLMLLAWMGRAHPQSSSGCLSYEPTVVRITGAIIERTFPGPPNYESIKDGDEPETYWLLVLRRPVCVNEGNPGEFNEAKKGIRRIQLAFNSEYAYKKYRRLLGRRAVATGTLYLGFTGHHKTPVLLRVNTLAEAK